VAELAGFLSKRGQETTMTSSQIKQKILERLDQLSEGKQRQVLKFTENLRAEPKRTPGRDLLNFFGTIDSEDCRRMEEAIEVGCERVDAFLQHQ
jgi:hypothetical protein